MPSKKMFKAGAILKVTVTDFVTYSYAEIYPGPNLNILIGPNGTGKSTIVAAVILGLGGNPKIVGRGHKLSEYIKHKCSRSIIEILLQGENDSENFTVSREFDALDKSIWKLNDTKVSLKEVLDHINKYNIQVNNLCQFLPQDRVQEFAKMNKQELLKQTKRAICREDLLERQADLVSKRQRQRELESSLDKHVKKLQECGDANSRLEGKVKNFKRKKKFLMDIKDVDRKIAWVNFEVLREKCDEAKNDKAQAAEVYERHKNAAKPIENAIATARKNIAKIQEKHQSSHNALRSAEDKMSRHFDSLKNLKDSISVISRDLATKLNDIEQRDYEINSCTMKLDQLKSDKEEITNKCGDVPSKLNRYQQDIRQLSSQVLTNQQKKDEVDTMKREKGYEIRGLENELTRIENVKQQRLDWLRSRNRDAYNATLWLRENKHRFRGEVFEPMMLELNVTNAEHAIYLENTIARRDRVAFTCSLKEDMNLLIRLLRDQQKLKINVVHSGDQQAPFRSYQPIVPIEHLKRYGMYAYLHSLFTGPEPIMKYLCKTYRIHCTPVGNNYTNSCFQDVPKQITKFFSDKFRFSTSYSKYTREKSTRQSEIRGDGSLSVSVDAIRADTIRGQLNEARHVFENYSSIGQELENQIIQLNERNSKLRENMKTVHASQQHIQTVESKMRLMAKKISQLREQTTSTEAVKQEAEQKIQDVVGKILLMQTKIKDSYQTYMQALIEANLNQATLDISKNQATILENKSLDLRQLCQEAEETYNTIKQIYSEQIVKLKSVQQKAKQLSNGFTPVEAGFEQFKAAYDNLPRDLEELEAEKERLTCRIDCLSAADDGEMREYEERVRLIDELEQKIKNASTEIGDINGDMERLEEEYMTPLRELVNKINERFSAAFEKMGCAGEVAIYTGDNDKDYEHYGLSIRVTYRNGEPLQELNTITQSGGERAVATATYMLSLQELTPVPFRCVDEINQGMDAINERRIYELLIECTSQENTSQYFLITPKLISNLKYVPSMKVHVVHNGPFVANQRKWNTVKV